MKIITTALLALGLAASIRRPDALVIDGFARDVVVHKAPKQDAYVWTGRWEHEAYGSDGELIWPEDPDEVPAWRIEREAWATLNGTTMPGYRTRREADAALDVLMDSFTCGVPIAPKVKPALPAYEAARRFVDDLRHPSEVREFSAQEVADIYASYCEDRAQTPTHIDQVKAQMLTLPGVYKDQVLTHENGKRRRCMRWIIVPVAELSSLPDDDQTEDLGEPMRIAA